MQTIKDILKRKGPHFNKIQSSASVKDALVAMKADNISYLLVMQDEDFKGIFSEREYAHRIILDGRHSDSTLVSSVLIEALPVIDGFQSPAHALRTMNSYKTRYLAVYKEFEFIGILTLHDLMRDVLGVWTADSFSD